MARLLLRLRLRLFANALQRGLQAVLGLVVGLVLGVGFAAMAAVLLAESSDGALWPDVVVTLLAVTWIGWLLLPMLSFSSDDTLDPRRFALYPLRPRELVPGLFLGALVGIGPLATLVATSGLVVGAARAPAAASPVGTATLTAAAVLLFVAMCVASSRALLAWAADALSSRRGRDVATALAALLLVVFVLAGQLLPRLTMLEGLSPQLLTQAADVARFTPGGVAGRAVVAAADGRLVAGLGWVAASAGWFGLMLLAWGAAMARTRRRTPARAASVTGRAGLYPRVLAWLPRNRMTAVAVRFLRSLGRDPRVRTQAMSQAFILVPMLVLSIGSLQEASAPLVAAFVVVPFGLIAANQHGLDGPALWQHHLAGPDPRSDLLGRNLGLGLVGVPVAAVVAVGVAAVVGAWPLLPAALLLALAALLGLLGVSNAASVITPYPVAEEASNPFSSSSGSGTGCLQGVLVLLTMLVHGVVSIPVVLAATLPDAVAARTTAAALAVVYGALVLVGGTALAVRLAHDRGADLLLAVDPRRQ